MERSVLLLGLGFTVTELQGKAFMVLTHGLPHLLTRESIVEFQ